MPPVGETALVLVVPEAEPLVGRWRAAYDRSAAVGVPAHVTVLYPWLPARRVRGPVLGALRTLVAQHRPFELAFSRTDRFPDVLYLVPEPAAPCRALTEAVHDRWPEAPPYGGQFPEIVPHLTVAEGPAGVLDRVEADLAPRQPVRTRVAHVTLLACGAGWWRPVVRLPLRG